MGRFTGVIFLNTFFSPFLTFKQLKDEQTQILSKDNFFITIYLYSLCTLGTHGIHHKEQFKRTCFQINAHNM